jgi:hypothetical protein
VPADHRLGPHHDEVPPVVDQTAGEDPEQLVPAADRRLRPASERDCELVAQQQVLDDGLPWVQRSR